MTRFGYLVPEFPGQTHAFFWRELQALVDLGHQPEPVSTRKPRQAMSIPEWARTGLPEVLYLVPLKANQLAGTALSLLPGLLHTGKLAAAAGIVRQPPSPRQDVRLIMRTIGLLGAAAHLAHLARTRGWTHIHVHSCADAAQVALFANVLTGIPYSLTLHGPLSDYGPNQRQKWHHAKFSVVITPQLLAAAQEQLEGFMPSDIRVAPMGVELSAFDRNNPYTPWEGAGPARLFSCGRLNPSKGHLELITAVRSIVDAGVDAVLTIAGEDEAGGKGYRATVERTIEQLGLTNRVTLLGAVPEGRIKDELERAHLFTLASHQEPLGVAIMEAMAMQVPVVATSAGGVPGLIAAGRTGTLVEPGKPDFLAAAILENLHNPTKASTMGRQARHTLEESFDVRKSAHVLASLI